MLNANERGQNEGHIMESAPESRLLNPRCVVCSSSGCEGSPLEMGERYDESRRRWRQQNTNAGLEEVRHFETVALEKENARFQVFQVGPPFKECGQGTMAGKQGTMAGK
jgi:hypothetical protein